MTTSPGVIDEPLFERFNNLVRLEISHLRLGRFPALAWENRIPERRLFLVHAVPGGGDGGRIVSCEARQRLPLRAGTSYLLPAHHLLRGRFAQGLELVGVHFRLEAFPGADAFRAHDRILLHAHDPALTAAVLAHAATPHGMARLLAVRALIAQALVPFLAGADPVLEGVARLRQRYAPILANLERPQASDGVGTLAQAMGVRRETLSRQFALDIGEPLKAVLTRQLARRASQRLAGSQDPVAVIAQELGFSGASYFTRFVRRHLGAAPLAYRRARRRLPA